MSVYVVKKVKIDDVAGELENDPGLNKELRSLIRRFAQNLYRVRAGEHEILKPKYLMPKGSDMFKIYEDDRNRAKLALLGRSLTYDLKKSEITLPFGYEPTPETEGYPYAEEMRITVPLYADGNAGTLEVAKVNLVSEFAKKKNPKTEIGCYSWYPFLVDGHDRTVEVDEINIEAALKHSGKKLPGKKATL